MPPKKREKEPETVNARTSITNVDQAVGQADYELFLQAFEKPTQIYRYLRSRNLMSPIFLNRTLSYMRQRMSRSHSSRRGFKVDSLQDRLMRLNKNRPDALTGYMTLTFLGFYHRREHECGEPVKVETLLLKICHKKRKESDGPTMEVSYGTSDVSLNPCDDAPPSKASTVSIPTDSFQTSQGQQVNTYMLLLKVHCTAPTNVLTAQQNQSEPAMKRRKSCRQYGSELIVYDKHNRCLVGDGDYSLTLQELQGNVRISPKKHCSWETISDISSVQENGSLEKFTSTPTLKFRIAWRSESSCSLVDRPVPHREQDKENIPTNADVSSMNEPPSEPRMQIIYQFLYNNNSRQQTEACQDLSCPWCSLDCVTLYSLLKHLTLCHARFNFTYVPISSGARIDVAINDLYDGTYSGNALDLAAQPPGLAFSRNGPVRRTPVSTVLVHPCGPRRAKPSLSEFLQQEPGAAESQRQAYMSNHNRLYHHTVTMLPVYPREMDSDSEGEHDPLWLQHKTAMMIDEFTDVNEGEKELMKMWNLHVMKHGYVGDCQIPLACSMFLEMHGRDLLAKNLYRNFVLHMCNLFDFGLVSPVTLLSTVQQLHNMLEHNPEGRQILLQSWLAQRNHKQINKKKCPASPVKVRDQRRKSAAGADQPPPFRRKSVNLPAIEAEQNGCS